MADILKQEKMQSHLISKTKLRFESSKSNMARTVSDILKYEMINRHKRTCKLY